MRWLQSLIKSKNVPWLCLFDIMFKGKRERKDIDIRIIRIIDDIPTIFWEDFDLWSIDRRVLVCLQQWDNAILQQWTQFARSLGNLHYMEPVRYAYTYRNSSSAQSSELNSDSGSRPRHLAPIMNAEAQLYSLLVLRNISTTIPLHYQALHLQHMLLNNVQIILQLSVWTCVS